MKRLTASITLAPNAKQTKAVGPVLDALDRWDARFQGHQSEKRRHPRVPFRSMVTIYAGSSNRIPIPTSEGNPGDSKQGKTIRCYERCYRAWARNIARGGMAFVYPDRLPERSFVLELEPANGRIVYFRAEVCRTREVHDGFWEHAVAFRERLFADLSTNEACDTDVTAANQVPVVS